ncbi:T9SS type A sorting domain-containing protein [Pedobacter glucosidilyticus]|uniref:T9SS type A sorting domain-containing protein n=1 Tax=Pedobacter glucosidilyticus TaxID=1122941 RepID=UPI0026ED5208|nr:T9SS type A sorting domain-containing protein [Pedobacter glucosidilyticus]
MKKRLLSILIIFYGFVLPLQAQSFLQINKMVDIPVNQRTEQRFLGSSVALSQTDVITGTLGQPLRQLVFGDPRVSPAYIASLDDLGEADNQKIIDRNRPNLGTSTGFGTSVAIDGNFAIVGEPFYFDATTGQTADGLGAAVIFEKVAETWVFKQRILASDGVNSDHFGTSVAISGDYAFVGTDVNPALSTRNPKHGGVYIFKKDGNGNWNQIQKLSPDAIVQQPATFGQKISVSGDYLLISSYVNAYIFKNNGSDVWTKQQTINVTAVNESTEISSLALSGDYAVLGVRSAFRDVSGANLLSDAGAAYIFEKNNAESWIYKQKITASDRRAYDYFGTSVALSGNKLVIGAEGGDYEGESANFSDGAGAAYVFERNNSATWVQTQKLVAGDRNGSARFGTSVAIKGDYIAVGASQSSLDQNGVNAQYFMGGTYIFKAVNLTLSNVASIASAAIGRISDYLFLSPNYEAILKLDVNGAVPLTGNLTTAKVWKESTVPTFNSLPYLARHYEITPTNNITTSTGTVTLFFSQQEFLDFNAHPAKTADFPLSPSDNQGKANIRIVKISGSSNNGTGLMDSYTGTTTLIDPDDDKIIWNANANRWEITFNVTGFSGFFANTAPTILPLDLVAFHAEKENNHTLLSWNTASEINTQKFEIERSINGTDFIKIAEKQAVGSGNNTYSYRDDLKQIQQTEWVYYQLKMIDNDASFSYSPVRAVRLSLNDKQNISLYPNPVENQTTLVVDKAYLNTKAVLLNNQGVKLNTFILQNEIMEINCSGMASGIYFIKLSDGKHIKLIKK